MKFTITVNQKQAKELGIKNINQAIILGLISEAHTWAEHEIVDGEVYYWAARTKIQEELELLDLKLDTIYRHFKALASLGLIEYLKKGKKDCVRLTKLGKTYYVGNESEKIQNSEMNPSKFGNESEKNSDLNPTYKNTKEHKNTKDTKESSVALSVCDDSLLIAEYLFQKILTQQPNFKKPNLQQWAKDIDLALRVDSRTKEQLVACIDWIYSTPKGNFWIANILSGKKLREKFDTMNMQANQQTTTQSKTSMVDTIYGQGLTAQDVIAMMEKSAS